ncbi:hypothetical protein P7C70_g285, partial [Phenoliferia sp. Uapishka_3]
MHIQYSEGRRLWSQVTLASRTFARMSWLHVPTYTKAVAAGENPADDDVVAALVEKKSVINLLGAFNVALKHYLRGEAGIFYKDLFPLVNWLPKYKLPSSNYVSRPDLDPDAQQGHPPHSESIELLSRVMTPSSSTSSSPPSKFAARSDTSATWVSTTTYNAFPSMPRAASPTPMESGKPRLRKIVPPQPLLPSRNPPPATIDDFVPFFSFFRDIWSFVSRRAKKATDRARGRKKRRKPIVNSNNDNVSASSHNFTALRLLMSELADSTRNHFAAFWLGVRNS